MNKLNDNYVYDVKTKKFSENEIDQFGFLMTYLLISQQIFLYWIFYVVRRIRQFKVIFSIAYTYIESFCLIINSKLTLQISITIFSITKFYTGERSKITECKINFFKNVHVKWNTYVVIPIFVHLCQQIKSAKSTQFPSNDTFYPNRASLLILIANNTLYFYVKIF